MSDRLANPDIFIHATWRTASTYFLEKFRVLPGVRGYFEPFNPGIRYLTKGNCLGASPRNSNMAHPGATPYWEEYADLFPEKGMLPNFDPIIGLDYFVPDRNGLRDKEARYIAMLHDHARYHDSRACYGFVRSSLRAGSLRLGCGGVHLTLLRNPFYQFMAFLRRPQMLWNLNQVYGIMEQRFPNLIALQRQRISRNALLQSVVEQRSHLRQFALYYVLANMTAMRHSDVVVDIDSCAMSSQDRRTTEERIQATTGLTLDLTDCHANEECDLIGAGQLTALRGCLGVTVELMDRNAPDEIMGIWEAYPGVLEVEEARRLLTDKILRGLVHCRTVSKLVF